MRKKKRPFGIAILALLLMALPISLLAIRQNTETRGRAQNFTNLNSVEEIEDEEPNNSDGTMGPSHHKDNFSTKLLPELLGTLTLQMTDPPSEKSQSEEKRHNTKPTITNIPSPSPKPTKTQEEIEDEDIEFPSGTPEENSNQGEKQGVQSVLSLIVTISKAEVHLASLHIPKPTKPENSRGPKEKISVTQNNPNKGQPTDKWETLNIGEEKTVDLVELAKSGDPATLGITNLAAGRYTEIRLYIDSATAVLDDGTEVELTIPGKNNIIRLTRSFVISPAKDTNILIDFDAQKSVIKAHDIYILKPVIARFEKQENKPEEE